MTYFEFLAIFLGAPLILCLLLLRQTLRLQALLCLLGISLLAVLYTGPWDNAIIANGVWSYSKGQVLGTVIGRVPLEEYLFYILQVFLAGLLAILISRKVA